MNFAEIENCSFAELKANRDELLKKLGGNELAERYLQARTDAKQRDEKLAEQGATIAALNAGAEALQGKILQREQECRAVEAQLAESHAQIKRLEEMNEEIEARLTKVIEAEKSNGNLLAEHLNQQRVRAEAAEQLAKARRTALASVMQVISPVLAAE